MRDGTSELGTTEPDPVPLTFDEAQQLDRARALEQGLYQVEGDLTVLAKMADWFPPQARHPS